MRRGVALTASTSLCSSTKLRTKEINGLGRVRTDLFGQLCRSTQLMTLPGSEVGRHLEQPGSRPQFFPCRAATGPRALKAF